MMDIKDQNVIFDTCSVRRKRSKGKLYKHTQDITERYRESEKDREKWKEAEINEEGHNLETERGQDEKAVRMTVRETRSL